MNIIINNTKKLVCTIVLLFCIHAFNTQTQAQTKTIDTLYSDTLVDVESFTKNLDSMLNIWYGKGNSMFIENNIKDFDSSQIPVFTKEMYAEGLLKMNTYIEMTYNDIVQKFLDFYVVKRRKQVEGMLGLSEYYFPIFEQALDKYGLPLELKYLSVIESALYPKAISRAGASGLWQFMYSTGKLYKLNVTTFVDERQDPVKASDAAARFLRDMYNMFHDWQLVIAAYNCGPGNVNKAIRRSGKTTYWGIYNRLPRETRGYVPAFIAAAYAMTNYKDHKMVPRKIELPTSTDTIMISSELHFVQVSEVLKIPIEKIRELNPQYKRDIIPANYETYPLMLPTENINQFISLRDSIFNYKDSVLFSEIRPSQYGGYNRNSKSSVGDVRILYVVRNGDTYSSVARKFKVTVTDLKTWNPSRKKKLTVGRKLEIYVRDDKPRNVSKKEDTSVQNKPKTEMVSDSSWLYYIVKPGDSLSSIARKHEGVTTSEIIQLNNIDNPKKIVVGQKIKIKKTT